MAAAFIALPAGGAEPVDVAYTWTAPGLDGWTHESAEVTLTNAGGYLSMQFLQQSAPTYVSDIARVSLALGTVPTNLSLRFCAFSILPSETRLCFYSTRSGRLWHLPLSPPAIGEWRAYSAPVAFSAGWIYGRGCTQEEFDQDVQSVGWVGVYVRRHSSPAAQEYAIDDFAILGYLSETLDTDGDGMPDVWENRYGLNPNDPSDAPLDKDGDGMTNLAEYIAGTDPTDPNSVFTVRIEHVEPAESGGVRLRWPSVEGRIYSVWKAANLAATNFLMIEAGIPGAPPTNQYEDAAATNQGPWYYRLGVQ